MANHKRNQDFLNSQVSSINHEILTVPYFYNDFSLNHSSHLPVFSQGFGMKSNQILANEVEHLKDLLNKIKDEYMDQTGDSFMRQGAKGEEQGDREWGSQENEKEIQQFYDKVIALYRISFPGSSQRPEIFEVLKWINESHLNHKQVEVKGRNVKQQRIGSRKSLNKRQSKSLRKQNKQNKEGVSIRLDDSQQKSIKKKKKSSLMNKFDQNSVKKVLEILMQSYQNERGNKNGKDIKGFVKKESKDNKKRTDSTSKISQKQKKSIEGSKIKRVSSLTKQKKSEDKKSSLETGKLKKGKQSRSPSENSLKKQKTQGKNKLIESLKNESLGVSKLLKKSRKANSVISCDKKIQRRDLNKNQSQQNLKQKKDDKIRKRNERLIKH